MILGFTGSSRRITPRQRAAIKYLFRELHLTCLHHGDCINGDYVAHQLALDMHARITVHPPDNDTKRAFCRDADVVMNALPYLTRNHNIVEHGVDGLVAAPGGFEEKLRSGTWATVRYARRFGRRVWLVFPDGTFHEDRYMLRKDTHILREDRR